MEDLRLTETEQRYFGDLFLLCCDTENTGKVPLFKANELFQTSKVSEDIIKEIIDLCSEKKSNYFGRKQFYTALKLIAAYQAGVPFHNTNSIDSFGDLPLPKFLWSSYDVKKNHKRTNLNSPDLIELKDSMQKTSNDRLNSSEGEQDDVNEENNIVTYNSPPKSGRLSVGASSTTSDSPTPTNSVQEKSWRTSGNWLGLVSEEQRQLLGTEEESSDKHSSEEEFDDNELWVITDEQRDYYNAQFRSLQPDPTGLLAGSTARLFFEKSKLPVHELRKIWQLSDITKDGALSLDEFNIAMHLVVLRRNNIPVPDTLPRNMIYADGITPIVRVPPPPPPREENSPGQSSISSETRGSKQWTKFVDSPTSSISSPGPKPVNFDFQKSAVEQDPKIYHPVPVRVTHEATSTFGSIENDCCRSPRKMECETYNNENNFLGSKKNSEGTISQENSDIRPIQRPQPRKPPPGPGAIPPPPQQNEDGLSGPTSLPVCINNHVAPKKELPPPPPPRPYRTHSRSSSLDLNKLGKSTILAPPAVPPRMSPSSTSPKKLINQRSEDDVTTILGKNTIFADFSQFHNRGDKESDEEIEGVKGIKDLPRMHGAFQICRKQTKCESPVICSNKRQGEAKRLEEHNNLLTRMCYELSQELLQVQEERKTLQLKLEQLQLKYNY